MKIKFICQLLGFAALVFVTAPLAQAGGGVRVGIGIGVPFGYYHPYPYYAYPYYYPYPYYAAPAPVVVAPGYIQQPVYVQPPPGGYTQPAPAIQPRCQRRCVDQTMNFLPILRSGQSNGPYPIHRQTKRWGIKRLSILAQVARCCQVSQVYNLEQQGNLGFI
jgi:hypothetical protein